MNPEDLYILAYGSLSNKNPEFTMSRLKHGLLEECCQKIAAEKFPAEKYPAEIVAVLTDFDSSLKIMQAEIDAGLKIRPVVSIIHRGKPYYFTKYNSKL